MKKLIAILLALMLLSASALAEAVTYEDPHHEVSFLYEDSAFTVEMDDVTDGEHLVILGGACEEWGEYYIRLHVRLLADDEDYPTLEDFAEIEKGLNTTVTQGDWNGFHDVFMYEAPGEEINEQVFVAPLAAAGGLLTVNIGYAPLEDEEAAAERDDCISEVLNTLKISFEPEDEAAFDINALQITDSPDWVKALPQAQDENVKQLFVVAGMGMDLTTATISMHEKNEDGVWQQILSTPGFVGRYGLILDEERAEGCGRTPVGVYRFNKAFGIAADPGCAIPYFQVDDDTYWSGDPNYHYNEMMNINDYPELALDDSEHIMDYTYQYQYCLNISFNEEGTPGRGSAIFLHCFGPTKPYTGGCVAVPQNIMELIMQNVTEDCVVVIDTVENLNVTF